MKRLLTLICILAISAGLYAQVPQAIRYQGLALDAGNNMLANRQLGIRLMIYRGSPWGLLEFVENHSVTTDAAGHYTLQIGKGSPWLNQLSDISWGDYNYYFRVDIDPNGGYNYNLVGVSQFLSVPFALCAANGVDTAQNPGEMLYHDSTGWNVIPAGSNGQVLVYNNGIPAWGGAQLPQVNSLSNPILGACGISFFTDKPLDGGSPITARGVCWSTTPNPTIANDTACFSENAAGVLYAHISTLVPGTHYYFKPFATNSTGTGYGAETDYALPDGVIGLTSAVTEIGSNFATSTVTIIDNGGDAPYECGLCYDTVPMPTLANFSDHFPGISQASCAITIGELSSGTLYYVRPYAKNCSGTSYGSEFTVTTSFFICGISSIYKEHKTSGMVSPVDKNVFYGTVTNIPGVPDKCWITSNLGADHVASSVDDATEASAGWYWQFGQKQGYKHDGITLTQATSWMDYIGDPINWQPANDPCTLELGSGWRLPTKIEWQNVDESGNWTNWSGPWNSGLKLHAAGRLSGSFNILLFDRGFSGNYWSSESNGSIMGWYIEFSGIISLLTVNFKTNGFTARCIRD